MRKTLRSTFLLELFLWCYAAPVVGQDAYPRVDWFHSAPTVNGQQVSFYSLNPGPNDSVYAVAAAAEGIRFGNRLLGENLPNGFPGGRNGCIVAAYESSGAIRFAEFYRAAWGNLNLSPFGAAVDASGNIVVAGHVVDNYGFQYARIFQVNRTGALEWDRQWSGFRPWATGIIRLTENGLFRVVYPFDEGSQFTPHHVNRTYIWDSIGASNYLGMLPTFSQFDSQDGEIFAGGAQFRGTKSIGDETFTSRGEEDCLIGRVDGLAPAWVRQVGGTGRDFLRFTRMGHDCVYLIYLAWPSAAGRIAKFSLDGNLLWDRPASLQEAETCLVAPDDAIYIAGSLPYQGVHIQKYSPHGDLMWNFATESPTRDRILKMDLDSQGRLLVGGEMFGPGKIGTQTMDAAEGRNMFVARIVPENPIPQVTLRAAKTQLRTGEQLLLEATAQGALPMQWSWFKNGEPIPNASPSTFGISQATVEDSGEYTVRITNPTGESTASVRIDVHELRLSIESNTGEFVVAWALIYNDSQLEWTSSLDEAFRPWQGPTENDQATQTIRVRVPNQEAAQFFRLRAASN